VRRADPAGTACNSGFNAPPLNFTIQTGQPQNYGCLFNIPPYFSFLSSSDAWNFSLILILEDPDQNMPPHSIRLTFNH
jgi:hypothetical protein